MCGRALKQGIFCRIKVAARMHSNSKFCSINSEERDGANYKHGSQWIDPELVLAALREFNNTNDEVYLKYAPAQMGLGRRPLDPQPLQDPGFFTSTAAIILVVTTVHTYRLLRILRRVKAKKTG